MFDGVEVRHNIGNLKEIDFEESARRGRFDHFAKFFKGDGPAFEITHH
jgi:hypothetical protein